MGMRLMVFLRWSLPVEKYYKDTKTFSCISRPDIQIPFKSVNDDYCDCPDGSDEPGTSACAHIAADKSPLPGFYCKNKGHNPSFLSFQRVNDGVCDYELCCDGTDEWAHVGGIKCEHRCKEIGKKWRKEQEEKTKALSAAVQKRKELVQTAQRQRRETQDRIGDLETEIQAAQLKVTVLKSELAKVRTEEKKKAAKKGTKKKGGKEAHVLAGLAKKRIDELREALIVVKRAYDDDHARVLELQGILRGLKLGYDPNFNDYAVKQAVRNWEEFDVRENDNSGMWPKPKIPDCGKLVEEDGPTSGINFPAWEEQEPEEKTLGTSTREEFCKKLFCCVFADSLSSRTNPPAVPGYDCSGNN
jgi:protein kinase C substrate 80K-H